MPGINSPEFAEPAASMGRLNRPGASSPGGAVDQPPHPDLVLACICTCTTLVIGLVAAINLAVPKIAASGLHPTSSQLLWIVDIYVVLFACLVIPGGAAGDRFGRKGVLQAGLLAFAAGGAVSAVAQTIPIMLAGRAITGIGAAMVLPNALGVLVHATVPERRGRALAIWAAVSGIGGLVGNIGGGAVLTSGSWRSLFVVVAPIALICGIWVQVVAPRSSRNDRSLDPPGTVLFVIAAIALLIGIIEGPEHGWTSAAVVAAFVLSVIFGACWLVVELRSSQPLLDPRLFRIPALSSASLGMMVMFLGSFGLFYINASLLQYSRGYSVLQTGLAILPLSVPLIFGSRRVPGLSARYGTPVVLAIAFCAASIGLFGLSFAARQSYLAYAVWLFVIGVGITLALPCLTIEITAALPPAQAGVAGGLQSATRELGSAIGVAVVGTVLTSSFTSHLPANLADSRPIPRTVAQALLLAPEQQAGIIRAFTSGACAGLRIASIITLLAGVVVVAGSRAANRITVGS